MGGGNSTIKGAGVNGCAAGEREPVLRVSIVGGSLQ